LIDVMLEIPMATVLEQVPVDQETKAVLLGGASRLRPLYQIMLARESGDWQALKELAPQLKLSDTEVGEIYLEAMEWAREVNEG
jgi:c-di-GMP-related signal transduction protein